MKIVCIICKISHTGSSLNIVKKTGIDKSNEIEFGYVTDDIHKLAGRLNYIAILLHNGRFIALYGNVNSDYIEYIKLADELNNVDAILLLTNVNDVNTILDLLGIDDINSMETLINKLYSTDYSNIIYNPYTNYEGKVYLH